MKKWVPGVEYHPPRKTTVPQRRGRYSSRSCIHCGGVFDPVRSWQKYCSQRCQLKDYNARHDIAGMLRVKRAKDLELLKEQIMLKKGGK